ncbi:ribonuclease HII [Varibaculum cambriense]|nr:ribonuclease HII [Varibaculum cambriense]WIK89585.1 ribonuclease HII [Varibaculum cambriense]
MRCVGGIDEVGRGAIAGPLAVGVAVIDGTEGAPPAGLTDSKQLTPRRREAMFDELSAWPAAWAVGMASAEEIDQEGLTPALRLAAFRALEALEEMGVSPRLLLLDGSFDYLSAPTDLFAAANADQLAPAASTSSATEIPREVTTVVKGDGKSVVIAAASVLAKVTRDRLMSDLSDPGYGWAKNKGYASAQHLQAIAQMGLDSDHRLSWHLQGVSSANLAKAWRTRRENRAQPPLVFSSQKG